MPYATGATTGYYPTQYQTYPVRQRRGLFGGLFRRRNRVVYPGSPYGTTYATTPYGNNATGYTTYTYTTSPY